MVITTVIILIVIFLTSARLDSKNLLDQKCCFNKNASWCTEQTHSASDYAVLPRHGIYYYGLVGSSAKLDPLENN